MYSFRLLSLSLLIAFTGLEPCFAQGPLVQPVSAVSRQTHGPAGSFDINLPLTGTPGIECRNGNPSGSYYIVLAFPDPVTFDSADVITAGTGSVSGTSGNGTDTITVNLSGVSNEQTISVRLFAVKDGTYENDVSVQMTVLAGDINSDFRVNVGDANQAQSQSGQPITASNFRTDVNVDGRINVGDRNMIQSNTGTALSPTTFTFDLDGSYKTSAGVYKPDGTLVRTLWRNVIYGPGATTRTWDRNDDNGAAVPRGIIPDQGSLP
jgi:hypothetical protein